jgi:hypothetical protein
MRKCVLAIHAVLRSKGYTLDVMPGTKRTCGCYVLLRLGMSIQGQGLGQTITHVLGQGQSSGQPGGGVYVFSNPTAFSQAPTGTLQVSGGMRTALPLMQGDMIAGQVQVRYPPPCAYLACATMAQWCDEGLSSDALHAQALRA